MSALVKGCYELVPIPDPKLGPRKLDVATMYNTERYRPMYANKQPGARAFLVSVGLLRQHGLLPDRLRSVGRYGFRLALRPDRQPVQA